MTTRTCDFCGATISERCPSRWITKVILIKRHSQDKLNNDVCVGCYEFTAEIELTANFNTSNMDWCINCMKEALNKAAINI